MTAPHPGHLVELLRKRARENPGGHAYAWIPEGDGEEVRVTYAALDHHARAIGAWLLGHARPGDRALLLYPPGLEYIAAFFGCLYAGIMAVPAYPPRPNRPSPRLQAVVDDAQATLALTTRGIMEKLAPRLADQPALARLQWLTTDGMDERAADGWVAPAIDPSTVAFLQYTSGTTAPPRGVMVTHGNLAAQAKLIADGFQHSPDERGLFWLPVYHDMGLIGGVLQPLWIGCPTTLMSPAAFLQSPWRWLRAISVLKANVSGGPDMAYELCARVVTAEQKAGLDLSSWELAFTGAEPIRPATLERFTRAFAACGFRASAFYPCYGGAENTLIVAGGWRGRAPRVLPVEREALYRGRAVVSSEETGPATVLLAGCGRPLGGQEVRVVDPQRRQPLPDRVVGEVWVRGPSVARAYWNRADRTADELGATLADGQGPYWRTRDLGFLDAGELFFVARAADVLQLDGRAIPPQEIEMTAEAAHPALRGGFGAAFTVELGGVVRLAMVCELERRQKADLDAVIPAVRAALRAVHGVELAAFTLVRMLSIPKTSSGKVQRYAARAGFLDGTLEAVAEWTEERGGRAVTRAPRSDDE
ncbi:MAG: fatty acyl-AMP ligase [Deltaproteobacteria bacterium]|nr:fatty acyl-AMP ligase [Deltaproteobacteria bacterium]